MDYRLLRIFGPITRSQAIEVANRMMEDPNTEDVLLRLMIGIIEPWQAVGEIQILGETTWSRIFGLERESEGLDGLF